jgi:hypothetical protein
MAYAGIIEGPVKIALDDTVTVDLPFVRVFQHPYPLLLLGTDVLNPHLRKGEWMHTGMNNRVVGGAVESFLTFSRDGVPHEVKCVGFPGSLTVPAKAGQCL